LASCLMLLQGRYSAGLIASAYIYSSLSFPCGTNPLTDGMMSNDSFQIVHDGAAFHKVEKMREFSRWPEALKYLRVCWQGEHKDRNCCRCQKCVWTMLAFRILGLGLPECFERDISDAELIRVRYPEEGMIYSMQRLVRHAKNAGISATWVRALEMSVWINRLGLVAKRITPVRKIYKRLTASKPVPPVD
jgi:hypothetical protein